MLSKLVKLYATEVLDNITENVRVTLGGRIDFHYKNNAYPYVPIKVGSFHNLVSYSFKYLCDRRGSGARLTFLDAGCGIGLTLQLARSIGFIYTIGLEMDYRMIKMAKIINGIGLSKSHKNSSRNGWPCMTKENPRVKIVRTDIRTSRMYKKADVVYSYIPMRNESQLAFMQHIINVTRPGTIIIAYGGSGTLASSRKFKRLGSCTYIKKWTKGAGGGE